MQSLKTFFSSVSVTWTLFGALVVAAIALAVDCVADIIQAVRNVDIPIKGNFQDLIVQAPIGSNGSFAPLEVASGTFAVSNLATSTILALVCQQLIVIFALTTCVWLGFRLLNEILSGSLFTRRNSVTLTRLSLTLLLSISGYLWLARLVSIRAIEQASHGSLSAGSSNPNTVPLIALGVFALLVTALFRHIQEAVEPQQEPTK